MSEEVGFFFLVIGSVVLLLGGPSLLFALVNKVVSSLQVKRKLLLSLVGYALSTILFGILLLPGEPMIDKVSFAAIVFFLSIPSIVMGWRRQSRPDAETSNKKRFFEASVFGVAIYIPFVIWVFTWADGKEFVGGIIALTSFALALPYVLALGVWWSFLEHRIFKK